MVSSLPSLPLLHQSRCSVANWKDLRVCFTPPDDCRGVCDSRLVWTNYLPRWACRGRGLQTQSSCYQQDWSLPDCGSVWNHFIFTSWNHALVKESLMTRKGHKLYIVYCTNNQAPFPVHPQVIWIPSSHHFIQSFCPYLTLRCKRRRTI